MDKSRLRARAFDGATVYEETPTFRQVNGWFESLEAPVGIVPAALWGKVPGGEWRRVGVRRRVKRGASCF
jgi:hypothetical protein